MMLPLLHVSSGESALAFNLHPDVIGLCLTLLLGYWFAMTAVRERYAPAERIELRHVALYVSGVLALYIGSAWPVHEISENYLASMHMFQHMLYTMVAPPLLIAGTPAWLLRLPLRNRRAFRVAHFVTLPLVAIAVFNALQVLTHLPSTVDAALTHHWFHLTVHIGLVASALLMWWPILSPIEELPRLSYPLQTAYLFVQSLVPTVIAAFITFSTGPFYHFYATAPRLWGLSAIEDQQLAGFIMKILGSLILWAFIGWAFFQWYARDNAQSQEPDGDEVKDELSRMGLPLHRPG